MTSNFKDPSSVSCFDFVLFSAKMEKIRHSKKTITREIVEELSHLSSAKLVILVGEYEPKHIVKTHYFSNVSLPLVMMTNERRCGSDQWCFGRPVEPGSIATG